MKLKLITAISIGILSINAYADIAQDQTKQNTSTATVLADSSASGATQAMTAKQKGEMFLKANKVKPGVVSLPSGLQYKIIKPATGEKPSKDDTVTVEYSGKLIDGTEFDSSSKHGGSVSFPVGQVIPGWVEALQLMPVGSTWELYIPSDLAYGDQGAGPMIGPGETLIFTIHLIGNKKAG